MGDQQRKPRARVVCSFPESVDKATGLSPVSNFRINFRSGEIFHKSDGVIIAEIACELVNLGCRLAAGEPGEVGEGYSEAITFCSQPRAMGPNTLEFMLLLSTTRSANGSGWRAPDVRNRGKASGSAFFRPQ